MRGIGMGIGVLTILLGVAGCRHSEPNLKPPKRPEELIAPPDDSRYQVPPTYNKMGVNEDASSSRSGPGNPGGLPQRPGAGLNRSGVQTNSMPGGGFN